MPQKQVEKKQLLLKVSKPMKQLSKDLHRPKLALVDANCTSSLATRRNLKEVCKPSAKSIITGEHFTLTAPTLKSLTEKEREEKCKKLLGRATKSTGGGLISTRANHHCQRGETRRKRPKMGKSELVSLEPDRKPSPSVLPVLYLREDCPDVEEIHDPQQCAVYAYEIYHNLLISERSETFRIKSNFLSSCRSMDVSSSHRRVLVNWMVQVHGNYKLVPDTLHIAVDILDRYLQSRSNFVTKRNLQLVGVTAILLASKYEDVYPPSIMDITYIAADIYTADEVRQMEVEILEALEYQLGKPNALTFLRRYSKLLSTTAQIHNLAKFMVEACYLATDVRRLLPSQLAAGALLVASSVVAVLKGDFRRVRDHWSIVMETYSWYSQERAATFAKEVATQMQAYFQIMDTKKTSNVAAVGKKYSQSCFLSVSALPNLKQAIDTLSSSSNLEQSSSLAAMELPLPLSSC